MRERGETGQTKMEEEGEGRKRRKAERGGGEDKLRLRSHSRQMIF